MELSEIKNKQRPIAKTLEILAILSIIITILPTIEGNFLSGIWALVLLGIFLSLSFFFVSRMFASRAKKMEGLRSGEKLLAHLEFDDKMLQQYANTMREESKEKNNALMWIMGIMFTIITIPFLFFLEQDEIGGFLGIIGSIVFILFFFSRFMPDHYYRKNMKGDKQILIGEKYAYFNGYFHNWDFPLSGLTKIKPIKKPFYGIHLVYYYTDRTLRHDYEIKFPIPGDFDPILIIEQMKKANKLG